MATTEKGAEAAGFRAFAAAVAARDTDALVDTLSPDVVLHSPITNTPLEGQQVLGDLYRSLFESFEELRVVDEFEHGDTHAFFWEGHIQGHYVAGADRLRIDDTGKVRDITVVGRPLTGLSTFLTEVGFHFARRRRGLLVARLLRMTALPLAPMFSLVDSMVRWLIRGRRTA
jgi:ketosteroid isomerase-like protein